MLVTAFADTGFLTCPTLRDLFPIPGNVLGGQARWEIPQSLGEFSTQPLVLLAASHYPSSSSVRCTRCRPFTERRSCGYRQHSQLERFRAQPDPVAAVGAYLEAVAREAADRGYRFDVTRIDRTGPPAGTAPAGAAVPRIAVTEGQVAHEWAHLAAKLAARSPQRAAAQAGVTNPDVHPLFVVVPGPAAPWERGTITAAPPR